MTRNSHIWLPSYLHGRLRAYRRKPASRIWLTFADHYEPFWNRADERVARQRVAAWEHHWPRIAGEYQDSAGRSPIYTFFYAEEEYRPYLLDPLARLTEQGIADVEVHIHHDGEGEQNFVDRIATFTERLITRHALLRTSAGGPPAFGFIHGDWALDNSHPEGRNCGLNNEIGILKRLGCYADFTLPSAPHPTQTRMINTIYWADDDPALPKSHDTGLSVEKHPVASPGALMMIPGPLGLRSKLFGNSDRVVPRIESGELAGHNPPTRARVRTWIESAPRIGTDVFIKLHTHGTQEKNSALLLGSGLANVLGWLLEEAREQGQMVYFVSAWQMKNAIDALLCGNAPEHVLFSTVRQN